MFIKIRSIITSNSHQIVSDKFPEKSRSLKVFARLVKRVSLCEDGAINSSIYTRAQIMISVCARISICIRLQMANTAVLVFGILKEAMSKRRFFFPVPALYLSIPTFLVEGAAQFKHCYQLTINSLPGRAYLRSCLTHGFQH